MLPVVNAVLLGSLLDRARLVPRILPIIAFIGAPLLLACDLAIVFVAISATSPIAGLAALPIAIWQFSLCIYFVVRGFSPSPGIDEPAPYRAR